MTATISNVVAGAVLFYAAIDRLDHMGPDTKITVKLAGWILAVAGAAAMLSWLGHIPNVQQLIMLGSAAWLVSDRRGTYG